MKNFFIFWLPPFLWMGFLFPLTNDSLSVESTSSFLVPIIQWFLPYASQATIRAIHVLIRKCVHFGEYALLAFLLFRAFRKGNKMWRWEWVTYAGSIAIGYGFLDEFLQTFISTRTGSFYDWLINSAGVVFALGIISAFSFKRNRRNFTFAKK